MQNTNNVNFLVFDATGNPNLTCIQVDDAAYMNTNWSAGKDITASFAETCVITGIDNLNVDSEITIYPNPFSSSATLQTTNALKNASLVFYNYSGQIVKQQNAVSGKAIM